MRRFILLGFLTTVLITVYLVSCKHDPVLGPLWHNTPPTTSTNCNADTVYFQNDILPIFLSSCANQSGCHEEATQAHGVYLETYAGIVETGGVNPGNPNDSEVYEVITQGGDDRMPPDQALSQNQIDLIYKWISQGAKNNYCASNECDSVNVTFSGQIWPMIDINCKGCHTGGSPGGGIPLNNYNDVKNYATPKIIGSIKHTGGYKPMPKNGAQLSVCKIAQFQRWIDMGMPQN